MQIRRMMQWSSNGSIIFIINIITLLLIPIIVHGINYEEEGVQKLMSLELVHRHDVRLNNFGDGDGDVDQFEAIKGFIHRDTLRRQRMNQRWGLSHYDNRRKNLENLQARMPLYAGRDEGIGEYFVRVKVGSPAQRFWLAADTGSEFTWFNCMAQNISTPHEKHKNKLGGELREEMASRFRSKHRNRTRTKQKVSSNNKNDTACKGVFCPHLSRTFEPVTCSSRKCKIDLSQLFSLTLCPKPSDPCLYDISYADGSSANGFFGTDVITVDLTNGKKGKLHQLTIGCTKSMHNGVTFNKDTGGILGLGYAKGSFIDKASLKYGAKFSYCLVDHLSHRNVSSYLTFGGQHHTVKLLGEMRRTDLVPIPPFYGVNVVGISVGGEMMKIPPQVWDFAAQGGTIIDSGTTLTGLLLAAYDPVFEALTKPLTKVKRTTDDFGVLEFCFKAKGFDESMVPRLVFHFAGGARFEPPVKSYIIDVAPEVKCLGIVAINGTAGASVIGNIMQQNHLWEYDLAHNALEFAPSSCNLK